MSIIYPGEGRVVLLSKMVDLIGPVNYTMELFINDIVPTVALQSGDLIAMNSNGYTPIPLASGDFVVGQVINDVIATLAQKAFTFIEGPATVVYGYFITALEAGGDPVIVVCDRFDNPISVQYTGDEIRVSAEFNLSQAVA